ncbi:MAG: T9SS type A sorting domain-containing protein [Saprospiraceae bacterium]|nr:T9SS type A sorting domain-containing protein [Candidatus Brachybacter algidus]
MMERNDKLTGKKATISAIDNYVRQAKSLQHSRPSVFRKALMGGSLLAALPGAAFSQGICHQVFNQTFSGNNNNIPLDLDQNGENELGLIGMNSGVPVVRFPSASLSDIRTINGRPTRLAFGALINAAQPGMANAPNTGFFTRTTYGNWLNTINANPITGYYAFRFKDFSGNKHNGWMQIEVKDKIPGLPYLKLIDLAYAIQPDANITAGATSPSGTYLLFLPIELLAFKAEAIENDIQLHWRTESEKDNAGFELQRSENGEDFKTLQFVAGAGTSAEPKEYNFTDKAIRKGQVYYYRLKQTDFNGSFSFSKSVVVRPQSGKLEVGEFFPNPANSQIKINISLAESNNLQIYLYYPGGQLMRTESRVGNAGEQEISLDTNSLAAGIYFVKIVMGDEQVYRKIVIK